MTVILFGSEKELTLFLRPYLPEEGNVWGSHFHPFTFSDHPMDHIIIGFLKGSKLTNSPFSTNEHVHFD